MTKETRFIVTLHPSMIDELDKVKAMTGISRATLVRLVMVKYLDKLPATLENNTDISLKPISLREGQRFLITIPDYIKPKFDAMKERSGLTKAAIVRALIQAHLGDYCKDILAVDTQEGDK